MSTPLVSVVIPTYNRASVIGRTIENILDQTYSNVEIIVVDDGSTDDTQSELRRFGNHIRVIQQRNAGPSAARNHGIAIARGEIIAFQDSDDLWRPSKLQRQVMLLTRYGESVPCCLCNAVIGVADGREQTSFDISLIRPKHEEGLWINAAEVLATRFVLFNQTVAVRRRALQRVGGFREELRYLEDYDLTLRLALEGPWAFICEPLVIYQQSSQSLSRQAANDCFTLKEFTAGILERTLAKVDADTQYASLQRLLTRRLRMVRRQLKAIRMSRANSSGQRVLGKMLTNLNRYRLAAFRRSPWFPRPVTIPVSLVGSTGGNSA